MKESVLNFEETTFKMPASTTSSKTNR